MLPEVQVPNLVLAQRVIDKMVAAAQRFIQDETGEAMVGLLEPGIHTGGVPTLYVLDTIAPDESAEREAYAFEQGDDVQGDIFLWLHDNWEIQRQKREYLTPHLPMPSKWDVPLIHLGDWHKQPGYMIAPSGGDLRSALDQMDDEALELEFLLVPIVTLGHPATTQHGAGMNYLTVQQGDGTNVRIDFWYIKRDIPVFFPISPVVYANDQLPQLVSPPWHILHASRADLEIGQLEYDGLFVSDAIQKDIDGKLPLEICFVLARQGASKIIILVTNADHPRTAPRAYVTPFMPMSADDDIYDMFEKLWAKASPVADLPGYTWTPDTYLIDFVHAIEDHLGIVRPDVPDADDLTVNRDGTTTITPTPDAAPSSTNPQGEVKA
jgi:hypothetical protein